LPVRSRGRQSRPCCARPGLGSKKSPSFRELRVVARGNPGYIARSLATGPAMVVASHRPAPHAPECRIELVPNCSLTPRTARLFVGSLAVVTFAVALFFAARGLWPIVPFAGLEIGLLAWAVRASMRRGAEREVIIVSDETVRVERRRPAGMSLMVFPRHWARVRLRDPLRALHPSRLVIESHGRACEVGRFLTEEERCNLASRLQQLVGKTSESPALRP